MFIGRERELASLNKLYNSDKFEFVVLYGRRRVGKTALINHFIDGKPAIYFMGVESNAKQNLENFSKSIMEYASGYDGDMSFLSFQAALEMVFRLSEKERLILAIDEYPYVARASKSLASTLQLLIETCGYFQNFSAEDKALAYGIMGGTPQYLLQMSDKLSIEENIKNTFLDATSSIYEEPINLLKQEVREPAIYTAIITAIATGSSRMSEISGKVGEDTNVCSTYLKNLITLGIVQKELPYGEKASKKAIYFIDDNMFRFWYRFVPENASLISRGAADLVYQRIEPHLSDYMGKVFEEICKQYLWKLLLSGKSPVEFTSLGRWWGNDPIHKRQAEIDIMGEQDKNTALFGECKWTNEKVDLGVLETLIERSTLFAYQKKHFFLFSKSGFTKGCVEKAKEMGSVSLITYSDILAVHRH